MFSNMISAFRYFIWKRLCSRTYWEILKIQTQLRFLLEEMHFASEHFLNYLCCMWFMTMCVWLKHHFWRRSY